MRGHKDFPGVMQAIKTLWNGKFWNILSEYHRFINKLMIHPLCHERVFQNIFRSLYYYCRGYRLLKLTILCECSDCSESLSSKIAAPKRRTEVIRLVCLKKKYWICLNKSRHVFRCLYSECKNHLLQTLLHKIVHIQHFSHSCRCNLNVPLI